MTLLSNMRLGIPAVATDWAEIRSNENEAKILHR